MFLYTFTGDSRPTTPNDEMSTENNNFGTDSIVSNLNGLDSVVICNTNSDIDNVFTGKVNQIVPPMSVGENTGKPPETPGSVVKKKNKRSKPTKSCELDYEELETALAVAAASVAAPSGSKIEPLSSSMKKKGHRRVKSGMGNAKVEPDAGKGNASLASLWDHCGMLGKGHFSNTPHQ